MPPKKEKVLMQGILIADIINEDFYNKIKQKNQDLEAITVIFIDKKKNVPIIVSHENQQEIEEKKAHIACSDEELLEMFINIIENDKKK